MFCPSSINPACAFRIFYTPQHLPINFMRLIFYFFQGKDKHGKPVHCKQSHTLTVQCVLAGNSCFSPADILACWFDQKLMVTLTSIYFLPAGKSPELYLCWWQNILDPAWSLYLPVPCLSELCNVYLMQLFTIWCSRYYHCHQYAKANRYAKHNYDTLPPKLSPLGFLC